MVHFKELTRPTIYRYVGPDGKIREYGRRALGRKE
jgi:hypothetical protein